MSGDATARIWTIEEGRCKSGSQNGPLNELVLKHVRCRTNDKNKDVTILDWNVNLTTYSDLNPRWALANTSTSPLVLGFSTYVSIFFKPTSTSL